MRVIQTPNSVVVNGKEYELPERVKKSGRNNMVMRNGSIIVNGYTLNLETGEFKKPFSMAWILVAGGIVYLLIKLL